VFNSCTLTASYGIGTPPGTPTKSGSGSFPETPSGSTIRPEASTSAPVKRKYVPDASDIEAVKKIRKTEIELRDRHSVLRGVKPNVRASSLLLEYYFE